MDVKECRVMVEGRYCKACSRKHVDNEAIKVEWQQRKLLEHINRTVPTMMPMGTRYSISQMLYINKFSPPTRMKVHVRRFRSAPRLLASLEGAHGVPQLSL